MNSMNLSRRELFVRAGGLATVAVPTVLLPRKSSAQSYGNINKGTTQSLLDSCNTLFLNPWSSANYRHFASSAAYFFYLISSNGLNQMLYDGIQQGINSVGVRPFGGGDYWNLMGATSTSLLRYADAWNQCYYLTELCEPAPNQVSSINSNLAWQGWMNTHGNSCYIMSQFMADRNYASLKGGAHLTRSDNAHVLGCAESLGAAAIGGTGVAGGYALASASGVNAANVLAFGGLAAATWWTGVSLIVIGVAWASYWAYQTWQQASSGNCYDRPVKKQGERPYLYKEI